MTVMGSRIAVLFHQHERGTDLSRYVVHHLADVWRESGHEIVYLFGPKRFIPADLVLVHVNTSVTPDAYLELAARYPVAINGAVKDIRKSTFSKNLVDTPESGTGPVIVKSDLNYAGYPERMLGTLSKLRARPLLGKPIRAWERVSGNTPPFPNWRHYKVYEDASEVPERYFRDPRVIVERFLPEIEDGLYHVRYAQFLGDRMTCVRLASKNPLVKGDSSVGIDEIDPDPAVEVWRRRLRLDYGKVDYVVHDGRAVLIDVNKTTGAGNFANAKNLEAARRFRAGGIESFLAPRT
jgi:hypothetical protein